MPDMIREILKRPLTFFDLETTSTDITEARIIELFFWKIHPDGPDKDERFYSLINPGCEISEEITKLTGIDNERIKDQPVFFSIAPSLKQFIDGSDLAGYNIIHYDVPVLVEEFLRARVIRPIADDVCFVDALLVFRKLFPHKLKNAYEFFVGKSWDDKQAHGATYDVERTFDVLEAQLEKYPDIERTPEGIHQFAVEKKANTVDYGKKFILNDQGEVVFNFGQHFGKPVKDFKSYAVEWMLAGKFPLHTKFKIKEIFGLLKA